MSTWLVFRPGDRDFDLNIEVLYQERNSYNCIVAFRHHADRRVKYVRLLGEYLAFADFREVGEVRVHIIREIDKVLAQARPL